MAVKKAKQNTVQTRRPAGYGRPISGGVQYANPYPVRYNAGAQMGQRPVRTAPRQQKQQVPVKKNRRRERDYFYIMRRGVCFFIMLLAIVWVGVFVCNYLNLIPQYTSFLVKQDLTPLDEREDVDTGETDDDGNMIIESYQDKSEYLGFLDPVYGVLKKVVGIGATGEDEESQSPFYDTIVGRLESAVATEDDMDEEGEDDDEVVAEAAEETEEEGDEAEGEEGEEGEEAEEEEAVTVPVLTIDGSTLPEIDPEAVEQDGMYQIATLAFTYFPLVLAIGAVMAIIIALLAFFSLFGRRIFKGFGFMSVIMLLGGVFALIAGMAASGTIAGAPSIAEDGTVTSILDFNNVSAFLTQILSGAPSTALDPEVDAMPLEIVGGYGMLIILIIPVVILLLSIFAKKKVPYSIFDK